MQRLVIGISSFLYFSLTLAQSFYQVDLIVFAYPNQNTKVLVDAPIIPLKPDAIALIEDKDKSAKPYRLLSPSKSNLRDEYYLLSRKSHYQPLGHYSWRQATNSQSSVALPMIERGGWQIQGTLNITQSSFYQFTAQLQASPPNSPQSSFTVSHKQRLQPDVIYYLDNAQIGMLVKIHQPT